MHCGGDSTCGPIDATVDVADATEEIASDAGADGGVCVPQVIEPYTTGFVPCDGGCEREVAVDGKYALCTQSCSGVGACPEGYVCDMESNMFYEFLCFPDCRTDGGCPTAMTCGGVVNTNACR